MNGMNQFMLIGAVNAVEFTTAPKPRVSFLLAGIDDVFDSSGALREIPWYHYVTGFGYLSEKIKNIQPGEVVIVHGKLDYSEWDDGDGKRRNVSLIANKIEILDPRFYETKKDSKGNFLLTKATNEARVAGNVVEKPQLTQTEGGYRFTHFAIAVSEFFLDKEGKKTQNNHYLEIKAWGSRADLSVRALENGGGVFITGRMVNDPIGQTRYLLRIDTMALNPVAPRDITAQPTRQPDRGARILDTETFDFDEPLPIQMTY